LRLRLKGANRLIQLSLDVAVRQRAASGRLLPISFGFFCLNQPELLGKPI
jgi:hypothetical protein